MGFAIPLLIIGALLLLLRRAAAAAPAYQGWISESDSGAWDAGASGASASYSGSDSDALARSVAWVESRGKQFDASGRIVTSNRGALGIMQLMPSTAASLGVDPYDEAQNNEGGRRLLDELNDHYSGNLDDVLAGYNWGQPKTDRAIASGTPFPDSVQAYIAAVKDRLTFYDSSGLDDGGF